MSRFANNAMTETPQEKKLLFLHIPKTGGITLKAILENNFSQQDCCVDKAEHEWNRVRHAHEVSMPLVRGHVAANVVSLLENTHELVTVVQHPVERFLSQVFHGMRHHERRRHEDAFASWQDALLALRNRDPRLFQNYWIRRALDHGTATATAATKWTVHDADWQRFKLIGTSTRLRQFTHLLCYRFGWPPASPHWWLNSGGNRLVDPDLYRLVLSSLHFLADDVDAYRIGAHNFSTHYDAFLAELFPDAPATALCDDLIESRLLNHFKYRLRLRPRGNDAIVRMTMADPLNGTGCWWREYNGSLYFRWLGPERNTIIYVATSESTAGWRFEIDIVAFASARVLSSFQIRINGRKCDHVMRTTAGGEHDVKWVATGSIPREGAADGLTAIHIVTPETLPAMAQQQLEHSLSTVAYDTRYVSMAIAEVRLLRE